MHMVEGDFTLLCSAARRGDRRALDRIFALVYEDLHRIAHRQLSARRMHQTLNTTALVHEAYLKLTDRAQLAPEDRRHFFATAARAMRQIAVDYARHRTAAKRGGRQRDLSIDAWEADTPIPGLQVDERADEILAVDAALHRLAELDEGLGRVVELRFFGGYSVEKTAEILEMSPRTVKRRWRTARAFLYRQLVQADPPGSPHGRPDA